ncbi:hypothetical protein HB364_24810 [Pseudoflavitalea sp. X16]|uniref:hypothetical protein n=1 Tax=Paraflavitalea devenefica TaxID=2716334 RepID=UPI00141E09D2|nr:hypothetical protein [Paraflavitalea devenefica]NII28327.1 hypothetical protein [Paraflavitalea devenefica]
MSAYNVQLPGVVIAGLYKRLVIQGTGEVVETAPATSGRQDSNLRPPVDETPVKAAPAAVQEAPQPVTPASPVTGKADTAAIPAVQEEAVPASASPAYKFLGNNRQRVAVIVRFAGEAFLPEQHLQMLTKMLGACKLNLGDVAIVNDATLPVNMNTLKEQLSPQRVLLFGIAPDETGLPLNFPYFKDQEYAGTTYLYTPSLEELNQETEEGKLLKRRLWECLKKIFGV